MKVGIAGASGYTGVELLRLCAGHPELDVAVAGADTSAGQPVGTRTLSLAAAYPDLVLTSSDASAFEGLDLVFCALPHGQSQHLVPQLRGRVGAIIDLAADFRLHDQALYPIWYGEEHAAPDLLAEAVYGLPELFRDQLLGATLVAAPGCYPTAVALALWPLVKSGAVERTGIVADAASGASGAGRGLKDSLHFGQVDEDFTAYGLLDHRHTPEMEQALGANLLFTPHLAPMVRGILATCYARPAQPGLTTESALALFEDTYRDEQFVVVTEAPPSTKATSGSNCAHVTVRVDPRTGWVVALCAIDNLIKGASGQAVQCANLALGLPEATGLPMAGLYP
jgi:N-acetyl-gamma-glutamyl-phosphate reductase